MFCVYPFDTLGKVTGLMQEVIVWFQRPVL